MVDTKKIESIRVVGMQKKKEQPSSKHYEFILRVKWTNKVEITIYRPYSMFFDFQGVLCEMFKEKYSITVPPVPSSKFHWILLGKLGIEKECRAMEEFCQKILNLPPLVSQSMVVLHFFDAWGTDIRALNQHSTDVVGAHGLGSPVIQSQETSSPQQESIPTTPTSDQYKAIASFTATNPGEISFDDNSILTVIEKTDRGWWFVSIHDLDQQGWAPATYLEQMGVESDEDADEWVEMDDSEMLAHFYTTIVSYTAQNPDEVSYEEGEEVEVLAKSNYGWWRIRYKDKVGLTPASNLLKKDEEYASPADIGRPLSISSASGLYAVVRKAPPRRDSVRRSGNFTAKGPNRFVYSTTSFSGGKFTFNDEDNTTFKEKDTKSSNGGQNEKVLKRGQSTDEPTAQSYVNVGVGRSTGTPTQEEQAKGIKIQGVEYYVAIADFTPKNERPDDLDLHEGDIMKLLSVDGGWYLVQLYRGAETKEGWVPSTYLARKWDIDLDKLNKSQQPQASSASPKPKPRPRPQVKPREKAEDPTPPSTPPIAMPRKASKPFATNESEELSPPSGAAKETTTQGRPYSGGHKDRPRLPLPTAVPSRSQEQQSTISSSPNMSTMIASQEQEETDSVYDVPEGQLRPVYDAEPWFYADITRQECEEMLKQNGRQQEFLIRQSKRKSGSYALSVKFCYRIRHFPIETGANSRLMIGKLSFVNLIELVDYYKQNPLFYSEHNEAITLGNAYKGPR